MIYTVICDKKWDCRSQRQSAAYLPESVRDYIESGKNQVVKNERRAAYSLLSIALEDFFAIRCWDIERTDGGKPMLRIPDSDRQLYISISHSDGVAAASICDCEEIGLDIQAQISPTVEKRLDKRFFSDVKIDPSRLDVRYFILDEEKLKEITLLDVDWKLSFTDRWAGCESIIKCDGRGFEIASLLCRIVDNFSTEIKIYKSFSIANSIKKPL